MVFGSVLVARDGHLATSLHAAHGLGHLLGQLVGRVEVVTVDLHLHGALTHTASLARLVDVVFADLGILVQDLTHAVADLRKAAVALGLLRERDIHRDDVGSVVLHRSEGVVGIGLTLAEVHRLDLGIRLAETTRQLQRQVARDILARTHGQLYVDADTRVVLHGEELRLQGRARAHQHSDECRHGDQNHGLAMTHAPPEHARIEVVETLHHGIDTALEPRLGGVEFHHHRRQHGGEGYGGDGRYGKRDGNHPTHRVEEDTRHTLNHGEGEEHGDGGKRTAHDRDTHLLGGEDGRLLGFRAAVDVRGDVLQHHNGVVDHHTDGDRERRERNDVERLARGQQIDDGR